MADDINLGIGFDVSGAEGDESEIEKQIDELDGKSVTVKVDADTKVAEKKIDALSGKSVKVGVLSDPVKPEVVQPEPIRVRAEDPTIRPEVVQPEPVKAEVRVPSPVKPEVKQPDPVKVKVETPPIRPKVEMPKETSFDALLDIADATEDVNRFQKKLFDLRGSIPIDVIVNCNAALSDMRRELAGGAPDAEKLQRSNEALAESLRNIGVGNLAKIGTAYTNLGASIKQISGSVKGDIVAAAEETGNGVEASVEGLIGAIEQLDKKAGEYGTFQARQIQATLAEMSNALKGGADLDSETLQGLAGWFDRLIEQGKKLPPVGLAKMGKELQKVGNSYSDFQQAIEEKNAINWKIDLQGLDKFDELNRKIEIVQSAQGLDDGIKELQAALGDLDPKNAEKAEKIIRNIKVLMTQELNADNLKEINRELAKFGKLQSGMSSREIAKIGPTLKNVQGSFADLRGKVSPLREEMKGLFDAGSMSASVLSGNVEGISQGLLGLVAGAGKAAGALKALRNSFAIGIIITGIMEIYKRIKAAYDLWKGTRREMMRMPIKEIKTETESINASLEKRLDLIKRINDETKRGIELDQEMADAARETANAQADLEKTRATMNATSDDERFEIEQSAKEESGNRDYTHDMEALNRKIASVTSERASKMRELEALQDAQMKLQEARFKAVEYENEQIRKSESWSGQKLMDWGIHDYVENVKDVREAQNAISEALKRTQEQIDEINGVRRGKDVITRGEIGDLDRQLEVLEKQRVTRMASRLRTQAENANARQEHERQFRLEEYNRDENIESQEYNRRESERQQRRRIRNAESGYGANAKDAEAEVKYWAEEEKSDNADVQEARDRFQAKMSVRNKGDAEEYASKRKRDTELEDLIDREKNVKKQRKLIEEQKKIRKDLAFLESQYYLGMEVDAAKLQKALSYRATNRSNRLNAAEAEAEMKRNRRIENEARQHGYDLEDEAFRRESKLKRQGSYGQEAMQTAELARGEKDFARADRILKDDESGKRTLTNKGRIKYERMRDEARQRITTARSALDDIRAGREEQRAEFDEGIRRGSNRLTAMGLGSGDVSFGKDVANNTKELVTLTKEMVAHFRGQKSQFATRRHTGGISWQ